jgi:hypothetical protein
MNTVKSAGQAKRPRIWVPGVLFVNSDGELVAGAHAGFNGRGEGFSTSKCGHVMSLRQWRHRAWMVERSDLDEEAIEQHAIILPESLLDPDRQPHARKWLASQPLVCVSGAKVTRILDGGIRIYTVEHGAEDDDLLALHAEGGGRASWSLRVPFEELIPEELRVEGDVVARLYKSEKLEVRTFVDRVLNEVSRGVLRESSVINALAARELIEPGYGYRGATHGDAAPVEKVSHGLRALDDLFGQIYERARTQRGEAKELARDASRAPASAKSLTELPVYGAARKVTLEEIVIPLPEGAYSRGGEVVEQLVLPLEARWFVDRVNMWSPRLGEDVERDREVVEPEAPKPWVVIGLTAVLVAIIAIGYVMSRG